MANRRGGALFETSYIGSNDKGNDDLIYQIGFLMRLLFIVTKLRDSDFIFSLQLLQRISLKDHNFI
jgi:hypothetical protein